MNIIENYEENKCKKVLITNIEMRQIKTMISHNFNITLNITNPFE